MSDFGLGMRTLPDLREPWSVNTSRRLDILNVFAQGVRVHPAIVSPAGSLCNHPRKRVVHPVLVIPLGKSLAGVSPATLGPGDGRIHQSRRLKKKIFKLKTFDQIGIPD